ncbi:MAG: histidine phosphatase family protein [Bacteroidetes bacterium]|nr:MAG: histidine phosphatase family protein [Bacteroidota bacterium]
MRIGLLRHFPVRQPLPPGRFTSAELQEWRERYDRAEVAVGPSDLGGVEWKHCIASDLERAKVTARALFTGPVEHTPLLREPETALFETGRLRLTFSLWQLLVQAAWLTGHRSQREHRDDFLRNMRTMAGRLEAVPDDTLVVCHAGVMRYLSRELLRRGWNGERITMARHAAVYIFRR